MENSHIKYIKFENLDDILKIILRFTNNLEDTNIYDFIFRGQGTHKKWELLPSLLRDNEVLYNLNNFNAYNEIFKSEGYYGELLSLEYLLRILEVEQVQNTYNSISYDQTEAPTSEFLDKFIYEPFNSKINHIDDLNLFNEWPIKEIVPLIAYSQHIGIPSRMLDFSYDFSTALYFALKQAMLNDTFSKESCEVISLNKKILNDFELYDFEHNINFNIPNAKYNPNATLQSGILMYFTENDINGIYNTKINKEDYITRFIKNFKLFYSTLIKDDYENNNFKPIETFEDYIKKQKEKTVVIKIEIPPHLHFDLFKTLKEIRRSGKYLYHGSEGIKNEIQEYNLINYFTNKHLK